MLTHVAGEFIMNMGRTLQFLSEQKPSTMSPEVKCASFYPSLPIFIVTFALQEIILHTLSESGIPEVRRLDAYIRDDVERYGGRLVDLERKLNNAWQDEVCSSLLLDHAWMLIYDPWIV